MWPSSSPPFERGSSITFGMDADEKYAGCLVMEREILDLVPPLGFFDLKEQLVSAARESGAGLAAAEIVRKSIRIHSLQEWRRGVREWSLIHSNASRNEHSESSIIDTRSQVDGATIIDSIVMENAIVGEGSIIARSAIGPNAIVAPGIRVIDSVYV